MCVPALYAFFGTPSGRPTDVFVFARAQPSAWPALVPAVTATFALIIALILA
jgi:hypothetical protein